MSLSNAVPNFIANVNREISRAHFVNQASKCCRADGRRNPRNNDNNNNSNSRNRNNNERQQQQQQQQQNGSYWMQNEEIPRIAPTTIDTNRATHSKRLHSWFYPVAPSRDEAAFHERNNFGFRNPQTHQTD